MHGAAAVRTAIVLASIAVVAGSCGDGNVDGAFLGGPLVAGYMMARNFADFGEPEKAWITRIMTIVAAAIIFGLAFSLSDTSARGIPAGYTVIAYTLTRHYQGAKIDAHINAGGTTHGLLHVIGVSIVGLITTAFVVIVIAVVVTEGFD